MLQNAATRPKMLQIAAIRSTRRGLRAKPLQMRRLQAARTYNQTSTDAPALSSADLRSFVYALSDADSRPNPVEASLNEQK